MKRFLMILIFILSSNISWSINKVFILRKFKGLNSNQPAYTISPDEASDILNVEFTQTGAIKKRSGYSYNSDASASFGYPCLVFPFVKGAYITLFIFGYYNVDNWTRMYQVNLSTYSATWTYRVGEWGQRIPRARRFGDWMYVTNGLRNVRKFSAPWSYDTPSGILLCYFIEEFNNRLWLARTDDEGTVMFYSDVKDGDSWDIGSQIEYVGYGDGERITGLKRFGTNMIIFKEHSIWQISGHSEATWIIRKLNSDVGCDCPDSIQVRNNELIWVYDNKIWSYNGSSIKRISEPIEDKTVNLKPLSEVGRIINGGFEVAGSTGAGSNFDPLWDFMAWTDTASHQGGAGEEGIGTASGYEGDTSLAIVFNNIVDGATTKWAYITSNLFQASGSGLSFYAKYYGDPSTFTFTILDDGDNVIYSSSSISLTTAWAQYNYAPDITGVEYGQNISLRFRVDVSSGHSDARVYVDNVKDANNEYDITENIVSFVFDNAYYVYDPYNYRWYVYDKYNQWTIQKPSNIRYLFEYPTKNAPGMSQDNGLWGMTQTELMSFNEDDVYTNYVDSITAIDAYWKSKIYDFEYPYTNKSFQRMEVTYRNVAEGSDWDIDIDCWVDGVQIATRTVVMQSANNGKVETDYINFPLDTIGRTFQFRLRNNDINQYFEIYGIRLYYSVYPER